MRVAYQRITDAVIESIEKGNVLPWRKPWKLKSPCNAVSGRAYKGINRLVLSMSDYGDHRWLTFHQAQNLGGTVKRGERGTTIMLYTEVEDELTGKDRMVCRSFTVFNVEQCQSLSMSGDSKVCVPSSCGVEAAQKIVDGFKDAPEILEGASLAAYYPGRDLVAVPLRTDFDCLENFYGTLMHELSHACGHPLRLNRSAIADGAAMSTPEYAAEELLVEIAATFLCAEAGIDNLTSCTSYVAAWLRSLKNDASYIIRAASQAQKTVDWILGTGHRDDTPTEPTRVAGELVAV